MAPRRRRSCPWPPPVRSKGGFADYTLACARRPGSSARSTGRRRRRSSLAGDRRGQSRARQAPTGSGKTLAAFLLGLDRLTETPGEGIRLLYVSPLKALNYDIERNLRGPLAGTRLALPSASAPATRLSATASGCCGPRRTS